MPPTGLIEPGACWVDHDLRLEDGKLSFGAAQSPQGEGGAILQFTNGVIALRMARVYAFLRCRRRRHYDARTQPLTLQFESD